MNPEQEKPQTNQNQSTQPIIGSVQPLAPQVGAEPTVVNVGASQEFSPQHRIASKLVLIVFSIVILAIVAAVIFIVASRKQPQTDTQSKTSQAVAHPSEHTSSNAAENEQDLQNGQYKSAAASLVAATQAYAADNNGMVPKSSDITSDFISTYVSGSLKSPDTNAAYEIVATEPKVGQLQYQTASKCGASNTLVAGSSRQVAVRVLLHDSSVYCTGS